MDTSTPDWHSLYTSERIRSRILGATTVAVSMLAVAAGAWGLSNADAAGTNGPGGLRGPGQGQFAPGQGTAPGLAPPGTTGQSQGQLGQDPVAMLFSSDGTVNEELLEQFLGRLPGGIDEFLQIAVQNGQLTDEQAQALRSAAGAADSPEA